MDISEEDRKSLISVFLRDIEHLSDEEYQQRVWVEGRGPEAQDYGEFYDFFVNEDKAIIDNYKEYGITEEQHQLLIKLYSRLYAVDNALYFKLTEAEMIRTPEWKSVTEIAKDVLKAFNYYKNKGC